MCEFLHLGSSISLRIAIRIGSSTSISASSKMNPGISMINSLLIGSSLSARSHNNGGVNMSVLCYTSLGSTISLRASARIDVRASVFSTLRLGSTLSMRGVNKRITQLSALDFVQLGSSISLRAFARVNSTLSNIGSMVFGSLYKYSLLCSCNIVSSLSIRSCANASKKTNDTELLKCW
jgi:hypothetical protein